MDIFIEVAAIDKDAKENDAFVNSEKEGSNAKEKRI